MDINLPFNGGEINSINENDLWNSRGSAYVWVGGNNGNKLISIRFQTSPDFYHTHVFEADDIKSTAPTFSNLGGVSRPTSEIAGPNSVPSSVDNHNIRLRRLNSTTAYMKIFTGQSSSQHFILEIDESDNSVSVTNIDDQVGAMLTLGGMYSSTGYNGNLQGRGLYQQFMYTVKENSIVIYSSYDNAYVSTPTSSGSRRYRSGFSQVDWDPINKTATVTDILTGTGLYSHDEFGRLPQFQGAPHYIIDAFDPGNPVLKTVPYAPVLTGFTDQRGINGSSNYDAPNGWESSGNVGWFDVTYSRDGDSIHFSLMGQVISNTATNFKPDTNYYSGIYHYYVITYKISTNTWNTTTRRTNQSWTDNYTNEMFCWLPLNTVSSKSIIDDSRINDDQEHCKTWLAVGSCQMRVMGEEGGGVLNINPSQFSGPNINGNLSLNNSSQSLQTMWLNDDHFMIIWCKDMGQGVINAPSTSNRLGYSIIKYMDENSVEVVSADFITGPDIIGSENTPDIPYFEPSTLFDKMDAFTLFSDKFARPMTISAPE